MTSREVEIITRAVRALEACSHAEAFELRSLLTEEVEWTVEGAHFVDDPDAEHARAHQFDSKRIEHPQKADACMFTLYLGRKVGRGHAKCDMTYRRDADDLRPFGNTFGNMLAQLGLEALTLIGDAPISADAWSNKGCYFAHEHEASSYNGGAFIATWYDRLKHPVVGKTVRLIRRVDEAGKTTWTVPEAA